MARYVFRDGEFVDRTTGEPMLTEAEKKGGIALPFVISDIPEYRSPVDGRLITSRSERRDDLKRHGCVEYEPSMAKKINREAFEERRRLKLEQKRKAS